VILAHAADCKWTPAELTLAFSNQFDPIAAIDWSDTSSKSARPAKDFESWETVSITEARSVPSFDARRNSLTTNQHE
jgi:hypothetical protein